MASIVEGLQLTLSSGLTENAYSMIPMILSSVPIAVINRAGISRIPCCLMDVSYEDHKKWMRPTAGISNVALKLALCFIVQVKLNSIVGSRDK